jgi:hypothetical protein
MSVSSDQIRTLVDWLGEKGARAGLEQSHLSNDQLREALIQAGGKPAAKRTRKDLASEVVSRVNQKIDKPVDELLSMDSDTLLAYFEDRRPSKEELLRLLSGLDFHPGSKAQEQLYRYAATQLAETGMFGRVAHNRY